ncbi:MAG: hypothetical protein II221_03620 [Paludibacteraceae bacterium]|nr:hypothetical protein [Paludibacteraceae bacterium]
MNFLRQGSGSNFFSKMVDVPLVAVNVILVVCMALASFSDRVRPTDSLVVSELGLGFPILLVLSVLFMLFWLARLKWSFLISLFGIILSFNCCVKTLAFNKEKDDKDRSFKLMTYNVHLFNFYTELSRNEILKYLSESDADVLCLQEFGYSTNEKSNHLKEKEIFAIMQEGVELRNELYHKANNPVEPKNASLVRKYYAAFRNEMVEGYGKLFEKLSALHD